MGFDINARIKNFIDHLEITPYEFSKRMGIKRPDGMYKILDNKSKPSPKTLDKIQETFPELNYPWLLTGEGQMLEEGNEERSANSNEPKTDYNKNKGVPYYDVEFTLSFVGVENSQQLQPDAYVTHPFFNGCDYIVRASGQSMAKLIKHGDAIGLIKIENWREFIPLGEIYAIVTSNGFRMIKIITKGNDEDHFKLLSKPSDNKKDEFPDQEIQKSNIIQIFKVQASSHLF